jgi:uncharacterized protein (TIGR02266 family)
MKVLAESNAEAQSVLMVDGAPGFELRSVQPVLLAGAECVQVKTVEQAVTAMKGAARPSMVFIDARSVSLERDQGLRELKGPPGPGQPPLVVVAQLNTPPEVLETCWNAGADDCIVGPLRYAQVQARMAAIAEAASAPPVPESRRARVVYLSGPKDDYQRRLAAVMEMNGFRLLCGPLDQLAQEQDVSKLPRVDLAIVRGRASSDTCLELERLRKSPLVTDAPAILVLDVPPAVSPTDGPPCLSATQPPEQVIQRANRIFNRALELRASERVPFFSMVEVREAGESRPLWSSAYSHDLSPGGIFLRTLVPARPGAAVDLKIHLSTTGEVIGGTGVVAWSNPFASRKVFSYPVGMGVQFLGMSPSRLGRLREICLAAASFV